MNHDIRFTRRKAIKTIGIATATLLVGCGDEGGDALAGSSSSLSNSSSSLFSSSSSRNSSAISSSTSSVSSDAAESSAVSSSSQGATTGYDEAATTVEATVEWASGNTDLITVDFPDDALFETASTCSLTDLTETTTEGPCYLGYVEREDISDGYEGLPMQLCLQLIDGNCAPLEGYLIEVWHCDREGIYSGDESQSDDASSFAGSFCTGGDAEAEKAIWFRGEMTTDAVGRVNFKTCFPGWYSGRTIHIHYRVRAADGGRDYVVSQFCFHDDFCEEICTAHPQYADRGSQNTPLSGGRDTVFPSVGYEEYMMNLKQNADGTLLAYKKVMVTA